MIKFIPILFLSLILVNCSSPSLGYQDKISYLPQEEISVYLDAKSTKETIVDLYDINENSVDQVEAKLFKQPQVDSSTWYEIGYQYQKSFIYSPRDLKSGIYYFENSSPFIVKNPAKKNDVVVVYPSNTRNAYTESGGKSAYGNKKGTTLNFRRPSGIIEYSLDFFKWLPEQGFNTDYLCDRDLDDYSNIQNYKVIIIAGHNEYWTRKARKNFDKFVNNGGNALILSGNTMWWQVRYEKDKMIIFKDKGSDTLVPDSLKTILWEDSLLNYSIKSSIGVNFDEGGYGTGEDKGWNGFKIVSKSPLFAHTKLEIGDVLDIPTKEYDGAKLVFEKGIPVIDTSFVNFYKQELIGYDFGYRFKKTTPSFIVFQKTKSSGIIINTASMNWGGNGFSMSSAKEVKQITFNCIDFLLNDKNVFSDTD
ncbi:MAG: N,N-dimethylformamidase beta subunit family domain-containing protein [Flavobacteriales bacterium]